MEDERQLTGGPGPLGIPCPKTGCDFSAFSMEWRRLAVEDLAKHFKGRHPADYGAKSLGRKA